MTWTGLSIHKNLHLIYVHFSRKLLKLAVLWSVSYVVSALTAIIFQIFQNLYVQHSCMIGFSAPEPSNAFNIFPAKAILVSHMFQPPFVVTPYKY